MMIRNPALARVAPFVAFMAFIAVEEGLRLLLKHDVLAFDPLLLAWLYLPKAAVVGLMLVLFWQSYTEISLRDVRHYRHAMLSVGSGFLVFFLWIKMDWTLGSQHRPAGFDPKLFEDAYISWLMIAVRVTGAVMIVPIMEELFWRSFLLRYLVDNDFMHVEIGRFSLFSFAAVTVLFGLEHHYLFAGVMAGAVFNGVYYFTRSIVHCILSHGVANLCLAAYVLQTSQWRFW